MITIISFFFIGVSGGFGHCVLMCHPFVLYISNKYAGQNTGFAFFMPHIYYNLGRIVTYSLLGAIAGALGSVIQFAGSFVHIQKLAAIIGGVVLIIYALLSLLKFHTKTINIFSKFFKDRKPTHPFVSGLILGFLPCGLSMGAVIGAASSGSIIYGTLQMTAFGIGTSIAMMLIAIFGSLLLRYVKALSYVSSILLLFMGGYFIYMGLNY